MPLTPDEKRWCDWVESLPGLLKAAHTEAQAVSVPAFAAGVASERERIRRELLAFYERNRGGGATPWIGALAALIDRICPE